MAKDDKADKLGTKADKADKRAEEIIEETERAREEKQAKEPEKEYREKQEQRRAADKLGTKADKALKRAKEIEEAERAREEKQAKLIASRKGPKAVGYGAHERGVFKQLEWGKTMMPAVRTAIMAGRKQLGVLARREFERLMAQRRIDLQAARDQYQQQIEAFRRLNRQANRMIRQIRAGENSLEKVLRDMRGDIGENSMEMFMGLMSQEDKNSTGNEAVQLIKEKLQELNKTLAETENEFKQQMLAEDIRKHMQEYLVSQVNGVVNNVAQRYKVRDFEEEIKEDLNAEVMNLTELWVTQAQSWTRGFLGRMGHGLRAFSERTQSLGDIWQLILSNFWVFLTGPWVAGSIIVLLQFLLITAYVHPYNTLFVYIFPLVGAAALFLINAANVRYPMDFLTHVICGAMIAYSAVILITSLNIHLFVNLFWLWMIFLILGFLGAFQIYAPGGYNALAPLAIVILIFGWVAMGPYGAYYHQAIDQVKVPLQHAYAIAKNSVTGVWLLMTNPTEWYARQQMLNVRPEKPLSYPKAVEIDMIEALPDSVPGDDEFTLIVTLKNHGDLPATNLRVEKGDLECNNYCKACDSAGDSEAPGCRAAFKATITSKNLLPGMGARITAAHIGAIKLPDTTIKRSTWTRFAKVKLGISYEYETASSLLVELMNPLEIKKRFRAEEKVYRSVVSATGKAGPAQLSINVGPQPLHAGENAILLLAISNTRPDGIVVLNDGDILTITVPETIRNGNLVCLSKKYYACESTNDGAKCTFSNKQEIRAFEFNEVIPIYCEFSTRSVDRASTGLITATLKPYTFKLQKEKQVMITAPRGIIPSGGPGGEGLGAQTIAKIAFAEIGTKESSDNVNKYSTDLGKPGQAWCADFAVWVYHKAGYTNVPKISNSRNLMEWFKNNGDKAEYTTDPEQALPGDVVVWKNGLEQGTRGHTGIVYSNDKINKKITTIEGNAGPETDRVVKNTYTYNKIKSHLSDLYGFGRLKAAQTVVGFESLLDVMNYAKTHQIEGKNCNCGNNCEQYAKWISQYSKQYRVDPLLTLSIMMQESGCNHYSGGKVKTSNKGAIGLMQIMPSTGLSACGKSIEKLKDEETNIKCGIRILKGKYDAQPNSGTCAKYSGWKKAVRGYVGCGEDHPIYVEEVWKRYEEIKKLSFKETKDEHSVT
jgi:hypothetical protein